MISSDEALAADATLDHTCEPTGDEFEPLLICEAVKLDEIRHIMVIQFTSCMEAQLRTVLATLGLGFLGAALTGGVSAAATPLAAGLAGGVAGNLATDLFKHLDRKVCERFLDGWAGIDENHHVVAALRMAQIDALRAMIARFEASLGKEDDRHGDQVGFDFVVRIKSFLAEETKVAQARSFSAGGADIDARKAVVSLLPDTFDDALAARRDSRERGEAGSAIAQVRSVAEAAVLYELRIRCGDTGNRIPVAFEDLFLGKEGLAGWFDLFVRDAADKLTHPNSEFAAIWNAEQTAIIKAYVEANDVASKYSRQTIEELNVRFNLGISIIKNIGLNVDSLRVEVKVGFAEHSAALTTLTSQIDDGHSRDEMRHEIIMGAFEKLEKLALGEIERNQRLERVEAEVAKAIDGDPTLAGGDIVNQVVNLISSRENALKELASILPEDNRVRSFQAAAEKAIASSDNAGALLALQEARAAIDGRRESDARLSAKYAAAQAELLLGEGDWQAADAIWYEAGALLEPFDFDAAEYIYRIATRKIYEFSDNFSNPDALVRSYIRCKRLLEISDSEQDPKKWADRTIFICVILSSASSLSEDDSTVSMRGSALSALIKLFEFIDPVHNYEQWLKATCTLGTLYALQAERVRASGDHSDAYIIAKNAAETFEIALSALNDEADADQRAQLACCLGHAWLIQGQSASTQEEGVEILSKSMRALQYADSLVNENDHQKTWAMVQMHAGCTLMEASKWVEKRIRAKLAFDAVSAIRASLRIYSEFKTPNDWAQAQCFLGGALMSICQRSEGPDWEKIKQEGLNAFDAALRVWRSENFGYGYDTAIENRATLSAMKPADIDN